eukprot:568853-Rhodomonas_salina.3
MGHCDTVQGGCQYVHRHYHDARREQRGACSGCQQAALYPQAEQAEDHRWGKNDPGPQHLRVGFT